MSYCKGVLNYLFENKRRAEALEKYPFPLTSQRMAFARMIADFGASKMEILSPDLGRYS